MGRSNIFSHQATKVVSITSGKGGVGKSTLVANLAYQLSQRSQRVLIFDGDLGMANVDIMFGARAKGHILDVVKGDATLKEIMLEVSPNVWLIPGGSGVQEFQNLNPFERRSLLESLQEIDKQFDYLLIDTAPGIADNVLYLNSASQVSSVVITPDPSSLTDSYALIKILNQSYKEDRFSIICNQVRDEKEGLLLFQRFNEIVNRFLCISLDYWGAIPQDSNLRRATHLQRLILKHDSECESSQAIRAICAKLERSLQNPDIKGGLQLFWENLVGVA